MQCREHNPRHEDIQLLDITVLCVIVRLVIPFRVDFRPGVSLYEQVVYAAKKAIVSRQIRAGEPFPSVRVLSRELKINPNTAHKVVTHLMAAGLLEVLPGIGTVVAEPPEARRIDQIQLLGREIEELAVEAKKLGIPLDQVVASISDHWRRLGRREHEGADTGARRSRQRMNAIRTENLTKTFRGVDALNGLTLDVPHGAVYALVGPNGAGKTTAIKILMNIFGPTSGKAEVLGMESARIRGRAFASIGYVSENQELPEWMRLGAFLEYLRPFYPTWDRSLEDELVSQFDLPRDRKLVNLSRGMKMKAALASSLAYHPKLIVLDEPFTGLDPLVRDELIQGLLARAQESTIFVSSHDLAEIESFASHVGYLEQGRLRFSEELANLVERFREVRVTFDGDPRVPDKAPENWTQMNISAAVLRFVESKFDPERTRVEIRALFGEVRDVTFSPMTLREIFLAMAKAGRNLA